MALKYSIFKMEFKGSDHFGDGSLESTRVSFFADTLFSALCIEAIKQNETIFKTLLNDVKTGRLCISDAFPYINNEYYIPKPMSRIESDNEGDSVAKKAYKNMNYIPACLIPEYINGVFPRERTDDIEKLGKNSVRTFVSLRGETESKPYRVGVFDFEAGAGLYVIAGCADEGVKAYLAELLDGLSLSGLGGKRYSGLGRFSLFLEKEIASQIEERLTSEYKRYMTLSVSLPKEDEISKVLTSAEYKMEKRSGFVQSDIYAETQMRKRDLYVFDSGACVTEKYSGDIYDVSVNGSHPVYRYAVPMFLGIA